MTSAAFICGECGRVVRNPYEQFTERMEYRRMDSRERRLSFQLRDICRDCVDDIKAARSRPIGEQGTLW